jgi:sugar O-acyltransferase (sialic acid O-acetyltransferase NeuD family)
MSTKKVIIFGVLDTAELAHYYLENDSEYSVAAFAVTKEYFKEDSFKGLPVYPFEDIDTILSPNNYNFFIPMTAKKMNRSREEIFNKVKTKGYKVISYVSSKATVLTDNIGENCFILEDNTIQPFVRIGNNVVLWSGNHIGHHSTIHDHVFFTSHVVLSGHCEVGSYSFFGVNATIRDFTNIAEGTLVAMSASVTKNTEPWGVYKGVPAVKSNVLSKDLEI